MKTPRTFVAALAEVDLPLVFNPYRYICPLHDLPDAARVRLRNLKLCLEAALDMRAETVWIARDLGYRGGRRTGVPLTDEVHLAPAGALMGGIELRRATCSPVVAERTAAVVWRVLSRVGQPVFLWNAFPLHPYEADTPLSNRCHTRAEREATWPLLNALLTMIRPRQLVAIGRDAGLALATVGVPVHVVRHPSYGGQAEFIAGVCALHGLRADTPPPAPALLPLAPVQATTSAAA